MGNKSFPKRRGFGTDLSAIGKEAVNRFEKGSKVTLNLMKKQGIHTVTESR